MSPSTITGYVALGRRTQTQHGGWYALVVARSAFRTRMGPLAIYLSASRYGPSIPTFMDFPVVAANGVMSDAHPPSS